MKHVPISAALPLVLIMLGIPGETRGQSLFDAAVSGSPSDAEVAHSPGFQLGGAVSSGSVWSWEATDFKYNFATLDLNVKIEKADFGSAYADVQVKFTGADPVFKLREAWTALYLGALEISLGEQIISWGRADGINPTNNFTVMDATELTMDPDAAKIGNLMARMRLNLQPVMMELIFAPSYRYAVPFASLDVSEKEEYNTPTLGAKVDIITSPIETSVSYFYGRVPEGGINSKRVAAKQQVLGLDFAAVLFGQFGIRGEGAWSFYPEEDTDLPEVPRPELEWVLGMDHTVAQAFTVGLQYYGKYVFDWKAIDPPNSPEPTDPTVLTALSETYNRILFGQTHQLQHGAAISLKINLMNETFHIEALADFNLVTEDIRTVLKLSYDITDAFDIALGFGLVHGPENSRMKLLEDEYRNIVLETSIRF